MQKKISKAPFKSVYFGGGTPSVLDISHFGRVFSEISPFLDASTEVTVEANPSSWSYEKAKALFEMGVNRLSIGVQSLDDAKLTFLSRVHDAKAALYAYDASVRAGFSDISIDFMYDTKFDDKEFVKKELKNFLALKPSHISAYSLTIEENTPFSKIGAKSRYDAGIAQLIANTLKDNGYEHYEVASFGKKRSKHNLGYWEYRPYMGVGAGAVGFDGRQRFYPSKILENYIQNPLFIDTEELSEEEIQTEKILLGLRSAVGVDIAKLGNKKQEMQMLLKNNLLRTDGDRIYSTDFFLADELALRLS